MLNINIHSKNILINREIILASGSPRRRQLLNQIGINHTVIVPNINENILQNEAANAYVMRLARQKAFSVAENCTNQIVIGADTTVVIDNQILGKPENKADACEMLRQLSNNTHSVFTGFSVVDAVTQNEITGYSETLVKFRELDNSEIELYVQSGSPLDKAGSYGIQDDYGAVFVENIIGDYYTVVGLPLCKVYLAVKSFCEVV